MYKGGRHLAWSRIRASGPFERTLGTWVQIPAIPFYLQINGILFMEVLRQGKIIALILLAVFAVAMGFLEGAVVYYLRLLPLPNVPGFPSVPNLTGHVLFVEQFREAATIVMLASVAVLVGRNRWRKLLVFAFIFSIWDLFYYVSLYFLIGWPTSLVDWDAVFLIPFPWIFPVWVPVGGFFALAIYSGYKILKSNK